MADVLHPVYLPFTADQLRGHFAPVRGPGEQDRHLRYYRASVEEARKHDELIRGGEKPTPAQTRLGRQMEKDERFWVAAALMSLYHAEGGAGRAELFARLLERAGLRPPPGFPRWQDALAGDLDLFFEVSLPSPRSYRDWLRGHLAQRTPIPYLKEQAETPGARLGGATKADAMLLAPQTGTAVIFEAKVLSDISAHVTFAPPAPAPPRRPRAGRSRRTTGLGRLGRLQRHSPRRLPVADSHPGRRVRCDQI